MPETSTRQPYIGRFAPTPSGPLHLGSLIAALASYLDARAHQGQWLVRIDDLDANRTPDGVIDEIIGQLHAHGLSPDQKPVLQSERTELYQHALRQLEEYGLAYPCHCTRKQLQKYLARGLVTHGAFGVVYPGLCREAPPQSTTDVAWRLISPDQRLQTADRFGDAETIHPAQAMGDVILQRRDGPFAYHLANVVDDAAMQITDVVRGADLKAFAPLHQWLTARLYPQNPTIRYAHTPLAFGADGRKLSKTNHAQPLDNENAKQNLCQAAAYLNLPCPKGATIPQLLNHWCQLWAERIKVAEPIQHPLER